jgi:hypothetical protein
MKGLPAKDVMAVNFRQKISGPRIGNIVDLDEQGRVLVDYPDNTLGPVPAGFTGSMTSTISNISETRNQKVLLMFEDDDPGRPIILDTFHDKIQKTANDPLVNLEIDNSHPQNVVIDGKRISFDAKEEIVLRCGKSSITLTKAGKVIIRGAYLLNRSSGVNRIKGGSVQIN